VEVVPESEVLSFVDVIDKDKLVLVYMQDVKREWLRLWQIRKLYPKT
jgi:hypothetical protein